MPEVYKETDGHNLKRKSFRLRWKNIYPKRPRFVFEPAILIQSVRIAAGSGAAMFAASALHLEFAASAGMVTLLTILTTRWETLKLSAARILTLVMAVVLCYAVFTKINNNGAAFGVFVFFLIILSEWIGWRVTASVNAVIGTHFLSTRDFSPRFIVNEFLIVLIGILIAVVVNLFQHNGRQREKIITGIRYVEADFRDVLKMLAYDLSRENFQEMQGKEETQGNEEAQQDRAEQCTDTVWVKLDRLEQRVEEFQEQARIYQYNTFQAHTSYYSRYFEMRMKQCKSLQSLHSELEKIKKMPRQADIIAEFIRYLSEHVTEMNDPQKQLMRLKELFEDMKREELPVTREEFESRAVLYHILMDLEEFLQYKREFVECIDDTQFQVYWEKAVEEFSSSNRA